LAVHVPIAGMSVLPLFFDFPVVLFPAHVAFMELVIDPACSTVFESEEEDKNIMKRPPRNLRQSIFNIKNVSISLIQGLVILLAIFILYAYVVKSGRSEMEARSFAFASLIFSNLMLITTNLSWRKNIHHILLSANKVLIIVLISAVAALMAVLYVPFLADLFHLAPLHFTDLVIILLVAVASLIWFEIFKLFKNKSFISK
jgi:Ca2+-transporting ATPase